MSVPVTAVDSGVLYKVPANEKNAAANPRLSIGAVTHAHSDLRNRRSTSRLTGTTSTAYTISRVSTLSHGGSSRLKASCGGVYARAAEIESKPGTGGGANQVGMNVPASPFPLPSDLIVFRRGGR